MIFHEVLMLESDSIKGTVGDHFLAFNVAPVVT